MASVVPGLGFGSLLKDSHRLSDFLLDVPFTDMNVPFTKVKCLAPPRTKFEACNRIPFFSSHVPRAS